MEVCTTQQQIHSLCSTWRAQGKSIGLVPTMGALHEGHASLIKQACAQNDHVVVSVFVNPIQFGPTEDYDAYPRTLDADCDMCKTLGVSVVFCPTPKDMYAPNCSTRVHVSGITDCLCGARRPGHFDGVCTVVAKLMHLSCAHNAYFGQKDAQQLAVIRRMVRDLSMDIHVVGCPIVREADGTLRLSLLNVCKTYKYHGISALHLAIPGMVPHIHALK